MNGLPEIQTYGKGQKPPFDFERWLFKKLSSDWCGNDAAPLTNASMTIKSKHGTEEVISFVDDAGEIGLGYPNKWHHIYHRDDFHKLVMWYLSKWALVDWFGLRRSIWFWLLSRRCAEYKKAGLS